MLSVPVLMALAWIVYELTAQPAVAAILLSLKFGWEDFRTGWWLRRRDPDRQRGRLCCWLYVSWGLWKAVLVAVAMMVVVLLAVFIVKEMNPGQAIGQRGALLFWLGAGATMFFGVLLTFLTGVRAFVPALWSGRRLWLNGAVAHARHTDTWPPWYGSRNRVGILLYVVLAIAGFVIFPVLVGVSLAALQNQGFAIPEETNAMLTGLSFLFGGCALLMAGQDKLRPKLDTDHPADCWEEPPEPTEH